MTCSAAGSGPTASTAVPASTPPATRSATSGSRWTCPPVSPAVVTPRATFWSRSRTSPAASPMTVLIGNAGVNLAGWPGRQRSASRWRRGRSARRRRRHRHRQLLLLTPSASRSIWAPTSPAAAKPRATPGLHREPYRRPRQRHPRGQYPHQHPARLGRRRHASRRGRGRPPRRRGRHRHGQLLQRLRRRQRVTWPPARPGRRGPGRHPGVDREPRRQRERRHPYRQLPPPTRCRAGAATTCSRGGAGKDTLTGGAGADRFVFIASRRQRTGAECRPHHRFQPGPAGQDRPGGDRRQFHGGGKPGLQLHRFRRLSPAMPASCASPSPGSVTTIAGDLNGDGLADFQVALDRRRRAAGVRLHPVAMPGAGTPAPGITRRDGRPDHDSAMSAKMSD